MKTITTEMQVQEIKEAMKTLYEDIRNSDVFESRNAKLYDLSYEYADIMQEYGADADDYSYWEIFCHDEWQEFEELVEENCCKLQYIGRTSSFYIVPDNDFFSHFDFNDVTFDDVVDNYNDYLIPTDYYDIFEDIIYGIDDEDYNDEFIVEAINDIYSYIFEDIEALKKAILKAENCIKYLNTFKENQIENFKYFLSSIIEIEED